MYFITQETVIAMTKQRAPDEPRFVGPPRRRRRRSRTAGARAMARWVVTSLRQTGLLGTPPIPAWQADSGR